MIGIKMPIQLDKIMADIAKEKALHPANAAAGKKEIDEAWDRISKKNKLTVHEARSIFKVLQKKYEQEKSKDSSTWKLFKIMENIHRTKNNTNDESENSAPTDEEEFVEMLEVNDVEDTDLDDSKEESKNLSEKEQKNNPSTPKVLNSQRLSSTSTSHSITDGLSALNKIGLTVKKTVPAATTTNTSKAAAAQGLHNALAAAVKASTSSPASALLKTAPRSQSVNEMKRKLSTDPGTSQVTAAKRPSKSITPTNTQTQIFPMVEIKQEIEDTTTCPPKINVITIPGNTTSTEISNGNFGVRKTSSTNGFSPRIEEIDFRNDLIFDTTGATTSVIGSGGGGGGNQQITKNTQNPDIINIGNFDNQLPPTFFKNLCNSNRYESLGLYVANVLNRISARTAAKLELNILRAIIDAKTEEMQQ